MSDRVEIGGVMRCCLDVELPPDVPVGTTIPCRHCATGGLRLVEDHEGERVWQAAWVTLGHDWRKDHA